MLTKALTTTLQADTVESHERKGAGAGVERRTSMLAVTARSWRTSGVPRGRIETPRAQAAFQLGKHVAHMSRLSHISRASRLLHLVRFVSR